MPAEADVNCEQKLHDALLISCRAIIVWPAWACQPQRPARGHFCMRHVMDSYLIYRNTHGHEKLDVIFT
jgi:hypothetical protein